MRCAMTRAAAALRELLDGPVVMFGTLWEAHTTREVGRQALLTLIWLQ